MSRNVQFLSRNVKFKVAPRSTLAALDTPRREAPYEETAAMEHYDVLIVGAGLSGIGMACHLEMECPGKRYAILERRQAIGGTWDLFRYPGIRSDSDMFSFGYKFRP